MPRKIRRPKELTEKELARLEKARLRWLHTSYFGHLARAEVAMRGIVTLTTSTDEAKALAIEIEAKLRELTLLMKVRNDG